MSHCNQINKHDVAEFASSALYLNILPTGQRGLPGSLTLFASQFDLSFFFPTVCLAGRLFTCCPVPCWISQVRRKPKSSVARLGCLSWSVRRRRRRRERDSGHGCQSRWPAGLRKLICITLWCRLCVCGCRSILTLTRFACSTAKQTIEHRQPFVSVPLSLPSLPLSALAFSSETLYAIQVFPGRGLSTSFSFFVCFATFILSVLLVITTAYYSKHLLKAGKPPYRGPDTHIYKKRRKK